MREAQSLFCFSSRIELSALQQYLEFIYLFIYLFYYLQIPRDFTDMETRGENFFCAQLDGSTLFLEEVNFTVDLILLPLKLALSGFRDFQPQSVTVLC